MTRNRPADKEAQTSNGPEHIHAKFGVGKKCDEETSSEEDQRISSRLRRFPGMETVAHS